MAVIGTAALVGVLVVAAIAAHLLGLRLFRITSGSMEPAIASGQLILTRATNSADLSVGDIVTTQRPGGSRTVTHRIVEIGSGASSRELWLKGDANPDPDPAPYAVAEAHRYLLTLF